MKLYGFLFILLVSPLLFFVSACSDSDEDGIPAYIHIERLGLVAGLDQGTSSHNITDAWVYIDEDLIGAFELPATFPVLKWGEKKVVIYAGIKINGISSTRAPYPFFQPITVDVDLVPEQTTVITDTVINYLSNTRFLWMENFDGGAISIDTSARSETNIFRVSDPNLIFRYKDEINLYSGAASLIGDTLLFECISINGFNLPQNGNPVFLELNYRNTHNLTVGMYINLGNQVYQQPILILNPSDNWNKIYINLTPTVLFYSTASQYKIFIGLMRNPNSEPAYIFLDNLKLIHN